MEKRQIIEIICVIAGFSLAIKAIDFLQFFINGVFQLLNGQGYGELYYFFIYFTTISIYIVSAYFLITQAKGISEAVSRKLDPADILIDLDSAVALEYALIIIGGITLISGLSNFLTSIVRTVTMEGVLMISGNMIWLNGLIKMILGGVLIYKAKSFSRLIRVKK